MENVLAHKKKTWPEYFQAIWDGDKTFEVRDTSDWDVEAGHKLILKEWNPETEEYSGRAIYCLVTYILRGGQFGLEPGTSVLAIKPLSKLENGYWDSFNECECGCHTNVKINRYNLKAMLEQVTPENIRGDVWDIVED